MGGLGGDNVRDKLNKRKLTQNAEEDTISRFIISPNNYWNMWWNNITQIVFVIYIFLTPMYISQDT